MSYNEAKGQKIGILSLTMDEIRCRFNGKSIKKLGKSRAHLRI